MVFLFQEEILPFEMLRPLTLTDFRLVVGIISKESVDRWPVLYKDGVYFIKKQVS